MSARQAYHTRQRELVLQFFKEHRENCYSAKEVIDSGAVPVGKATVYRHLAALAAENRLNTFQSEHRDGTRYQYNDAASCLGHYHLKCLRCGNVIHLNCAAAQVFEQHMERDHDFAVDASRTVFYGICSRCR